MIKVYILTIEALTAFSNIVHESAWSSYEKAQERAAKVVALEIRRATFNGWDASERDYNVGITEMHVDKD